MRKPRKESLLPITRNLRKNMTREERHLWYDFLRKYPVRFRKQEIIGGYIADFFCHKANIVIELDGGHHYDEKEIEYDRRRTAYMNGLGIKVLRYSNLDVMNHFDGVCRDIDRHIHLSVGFADSSPQGEPY